MAPLEFETYTLDPRPHYPFLITAKRYWNPSHYHDDDDALTVILAHATGYHKEHWEPTIEDFYDVLAEAGSNNPVKIREFWAIDAPNHGDAAVLNEELLTWGHTPIFDWQEYARSIHAVLTNLGTGINVDFRSRKLVGVGHSMGAVSIILAGTFMPEIKFLSVILVEPMIYKTGGPIVNFIELSARRRDIWPGYQEAYNQFSSRAAYQAWDSRVLDAYVKHGLRDLPSAEYPDKQGVTLKCTKAQELACYRDTVGKARVWTYMDHLCSTIPVHFIFGAINDSVSKKTQEDLLRNSAKGLQASVARVPGAGHLIVQTSPRALAEAIYVDLGSDIASDFVPGPARTGVQSRL
ncbi:Alpha/beta hydrolase fold-1 [Irpex rosettiformis]|uniref:Alpha/beta hydrolase fold-1 n=1 Tax=Irpex rosettiformis TaxID=378272 RepID=A0ACB8U5E7_9APHY|nr:Alpha/beta hydrolase fold-1 [Irpex rosettiformis]